MQKTESERLNDLKLSIVAEGVTVWEMPLEKFIKEASDRGGMFGADAYETAGALYFDTTMYPKGNWTEWPIKIMVLNPKKTETERYRSAVHEWGHHKCRSSGCACSTPNYFHPLTEAHAHQFTIEHLLKEWPEQVDRYVLGMVPECGEFFKRREPDAHLRGALLALLLHRHISKHGLPSLPENSTQDDQTDRENLENLYSGLPVARLKDDAEKTARNCATDRLPEVMKFVSA